VSISYYYALPYKLFEYILAEIPLIAKNLPHLKKIIDTFKTGFSIDENNLAQLKEILTILKEDEKSYNQIKLNCKKASEELNWDDEITKLISVL
ncbi:glycosyltransferase, partial [Ignavibacterium album]|uniref:glycosyltransferase n=1 Tax=Ignavibacterium album TaxID=591197 RepID=UPI0038B3EC59